jgi:hypothetical protein
VFYLNGGVDGRKKTETGDDGRVGGKIKGILIK